jgi:hypothetical protein
MRKTFALAATALAALSALAIPGVSQARHHHYYERCEDDRRHAATTGTIVGALGGALVGNALSHGGGKTGGTLIGAGVGAVAGHEIAKNNHRC